jgi:UrcA family protein
VRNGDATRSPPEKADKPKEHPMSNRHETKPSRARHALALTVLAALAATAAPAALAGGSDTAQVAVRYADLDLDTEAGARTLYARIAAAARSVCPAPDARDLHRSRAARECQANAIAQAVGAVGSTRLAAIEAARRGKSRLT